MKSAAAAILLLGLGLSPAAACGWEGERCCSTKKGGEACKVDGLVCISGRCKPEPACGGNGEACCPDEECDLHSLVCLSGSCTPCGKEGEPVCNEDGVSPCNEGLEPSGGICSVICGDEGWPCCADDTCKVDGLVCTEGTCSKPAPCGKEGEPVCTEDGVSPCNTGLVDSEGVCSKPPCGKLGEPICDEAPICEGDLIDVGGICSKPPCGKLGEPVCDEAPICEGDLIDVDGICSEAPCGGAGETCCPGDKCDLHSLGCVGGTCVPCGKEGQPTCTEDGVSPCNEGLIDSDGTCEAPDCGEKNEECCPGDICEGATLICAQGFCLPCGTIGKQTCAGDEPCVEELVAVGGFCQPAPEECGAKGDVCCPDDKCDGDDTICRMGFCRECGTEGKIACAGDEPCQEGLEVSSGGLCIGTKKLSFGFKW